MDATTAARIEATHGPSIIWRNNQIGYVCRCGAGWPCPIFLRADDYRQQQHRLTRAVQQAEPWEPGAAGTTRQSRP